MKKLLALLVCLCLLLGLAACGRPAEATPSVTPTATSAPTPTALPTATTALTPTTAPTPTAVPTTLPTVLPTPTAEPTPPPTAAPTAGPAATPAPTHVHAFAAASCSAPARCGCGATQGAALGHTFSATDCVKPHICTRCGAVKGPAAGHAYAPATCDTPETCSVCGATRGDALAHDYVLGECTACGNYSETYCPKLYFAGNMNGMENKKDVRSITFEYRSRQQIVTGAAKIKVQGSSSLAYEKKNYTINLFENTAYTDELGIDVGWGAQSEYCLKANWIDMTHSRNVVTAQLAAEAQALYGLFADTPHNGTIDGFPVEVYINGSFHGLYTMNIPKAAWMFNMDEDNPNHIVICGENWQDPVRFLELPTDFSAWGLEVGPETDATLQKIQRMVGFVRDSSNKTFKQNFSQYFDLDSMLNYYVMMNYCWLPDNIGKNMLLVTYDGNFWTPSLYDLDTSWGTNWTGEELNNYKNHLFGRGESMLWSRMEAVFSKEIAERYFELRQTVLDVDYVKSKFNAFYSSIPDEVLAREKAKWNKPETPIPGYPISQIEDYLDSVIPRLDAHFETWR